MNLIPRPKIKNLFFSIVNQTRRSYDTLTSEEYLINQRDSNLVREIHNNVLFPLPNCNHGEGTTDEISLYGIPYGDDWDNPKYDIFLRALEAHHPDLIFLQISPAAYIARQRFLAHKTALHGVEDYELQGVDTIQPEAPLNFEECIINLTTLDMLKDNKLYSDVNLKKGFSTYSYPFLQEKAVAEDLKPKFIESINNNIICGEHSDFLIINSILYKALMGKNKVILGDMPELLYRRILGNALSIHELRDLFKFLLENIGKLKHPISLREAAYNFTPHIFQTPKDLYLTAMLRESFQMSTCIAAFVGIHHFNPMQKYWVGPPTGINYSEATRIPSRVLGETDEEQIEKQALLDVILEKKAWAPKYVNNPFSYLVDDITKVPDNDLLNMKNCFKFHYSKYLKFKDMKQKAIPDFGATKISMMLPKKAHQQESFETSLNMLSDEEKNILDKSKSSFKLSHLVNTKKNLVK